MENKLRTRVYTGNKNQIGDQTREQTEPKRLTSGARERKSIVGLSSASDPRHAALRGEARRGRSHATNRRFDSRNDDDRPENFQRQRLESRSYEARGVRSRGK